MTLSLFVTWLKSSGLISLITNFPSSSFSLVRFPQASLKISPSKAIGFSKFLIPAKSPDLTFSLYICAILLASFIWSFSMIPTSPEIARAVLMLSPVTILTVIPAFLHFLIASGTSALLLSLIPIMKANVSP